MPGGNVPLKQPLGVPFKGKIFQDQESDLKPFDTKKYLENRKTIPLINDPPYSSPEWIQTTIRSIRRFVLENASTAFKIHNHGDIQNPIIKISI